MSGRSQWECSIQFKKQKMFLSASAGAGLGDRVDIYERGTVMALENAAGGALHPIRNSTRSTRKDISHQSLYDYLVEKFSLSEGGKLTAWHDARGTLLFGLPADEQESVWIFDQRFHKLELPIEQFENCTAFIDHGVLTIGRAASTRLKGRINVYEHEETLCLANHPKGMLTVETRPHHAIGIASMELVSYIRSKFSEKSGRLMVRICDGRVYLSNKLPEKNQNFSLFTPLKFGMSQREARVTLTQYGVLRIPAPMAQNMGEWAEIQQHGDVVALVSNTSGRGLRLNRNAESGVVTISSVALRRELQKKFDFEGPMRFYSRRIDGAVCFSDRDLKDEVLNLADFRERVSDECAKRFISLTHNNLYFSNTLDVGIDRRFDLFRFGDLFALLESERGSFQVANNQRMIACAKLAQYLQREFGVTERVRLCARTVSGGVIFSKAAIDVTHQPDLSQPRQKKVPCWAIQSYAGVGE